MNKLVFITFCITFSIIKTDIIDWFKTDPYVVFDWLDEDSKTLTITNSATGFKSCLLYNNSRVCYGTCSGTTKITCTFKGENCGGDPDNPAVKYYYSTYCSTSGLTGQSGNATSSILTGTDDVGVTVAICNSNFIKYSMVLLLSLLVL
jgi:hypothetical protein